MLADFLLEVTATQSGVDLALIHVWNLLTSGVFLI